MRKITVKVDIQNETIIVKCGKIEIQYSGGFYSEASINEIINDFKRLFGDKIKK